MKNQCTISEEGSLLLRLIRRLWHIATWWVFENESQGEINASAPEQTVTLTATTCVLQSFDGGNSMLMEDAKYHEQPQSSFQQPHPPQYGQHDNQEKVGIFFSSPIIIVQAKCNFSLTAARSASTRTSMIIIYRTKSVHVR